MIFNIKTVQMRSVQPMKATRVVAARAGSQGGYLRSMQARSPSVGR